MPSIPIPQQVPIERAGWSDAFNGNVQMPDNARTPVNAIDIANQQGVMQSQNALRQAQTVNAAQDAQQKQRSFQLSMLNGVMALPPEQQADALSKVVPMMNRMGPTQFEAAMTPAMAKMYTMSNVPTEQIPQYQMMQGQAGLLNALRDRLAPQGMQGAQLGQQQPMMQPGQQGAPMPANGIIGNGQGSAAPIPAGGGQQIDPQTLELMAAVKPDMANAMVGVQKLQNESPAGKGAIQGAEKNADNLADATKTFNITASNLPLALQRFQKLREAAANASYGAGVDQEGKGFLPSLSQTSIGQFLEPDTAAANQTLHQVANQGLISELGPSLQGMKPNKFLESMASGGNLINFRDPPAVKQQAVDNIENQYIGQLKASAAQRRAYGDQTAPTDAQIDAQVAQLKSKGNAGGNQQQTGGRVQVITPDGKMGTIDSAHLNDLISAGGRLLK